MVTFRNNNNNRRSNFRRNTRNFKSNGDNSKFGSNFASNDNFKRKAPGRNNHNAPKLIEKYNDQNQTIEEAYYSADGKLAINTEWEFARKLTIYDDQNRVIRESFFGDGGEPILYEGVFHHLERQYNQDGKLVALRSLNKFGKVVFSLINRFYHQFQ